MLLFCFYNEYISLQMKEIHKISILEEIILVLNDVNKKLSVRRFRRHCIA